MAGHKEYVGVGRTDKKPWGDEVVLSLSRDDLDKLYDLLYNDWVKVSIKARKEAKGDKTHYGQVWVPESSESDSGADMSASSGVPPLGGGSDDGIPDLSETQDEQLPF